jgi:microcystin-dependent protein
MDMYLGTVVLLAFNYAPPEFMPCDGQVLQIAQYQALYALLGTTYGGNGSTTFCLPNLNGAGGRPSSAPNVNGFNKYYIVVQGLFPPRQ